MVESLTNFPFRKFKGRKYLTLLVMKHYGYDESRKFMFSLNKDSRSYLLKEKTTIDNDFINEGLITYDLGDGTFTDFLYLEKIY